ncbi:MAG: nodulation protein NodH, partial [Paracoccaceae bacterium]|nr:nodulation protein NodH [Paracoccaceae bacterium]
MPSRFEYFVVLAEMRTGSNFLEQCLNEYPGITTYGELFNPVFIGTHTEFELLGMSLADRDADPANMIELVKKDTDGLAGFRVFHDHHPAAIAQCLDDPACAKIVLTRNPLDSYISEKIAARTDQWRLTDMKNALTAQIEFEAEEFNTLLDTRLAFQKKMLRRLQISGQTAYYLDYEDISDPDIMNGLVRYLGVDGARKAVSRKTRKQNPQPLTEKLTNFEEMEQALAKIDFFALSEFPNFEPRR